MQAVRLVPSLGFQTLSVRKASVHMPYNCVFGNRRRTSCPKYKLLHARRVPSGYIIERRHEAKPSVPRGDVSARHVSASNNAFVTHQLAETHYGTALHFLQVISTVAAQSFVDVERY